MTDRKTGEAGYARTTRNIRVSVEPFYLAEQSSPEEGRHMFAYRIRIENHGGITVQLRNRNWRITDAYGRVQEVHGAGVVGEQPILAPGEAFEYTSGTPLATDTGIMVGSYEMVTENGERFEVAIPAFSLDTPGAVRRVQ